MNTNKAQAVGIAVGELAAKGTIIAQEGVIKAKVVAGEVKKNTGLFTGGIVAGFLKTRIEYQMKKLQEKPVEKANEMKTEEIPA